MIVDRREWGCRGREGGYGVRRRGERKKGKRAGDNGEMGNRERPSRASDTQTDRQHNVLRAAVSSFSFFCPLFPFPLSFPSQSHCIWGPLPQLTPLPNYHSFPSIREKEGTKVKENPHCEIFICLCV